MTAIELLAWLMDEAFQGPGLEQSGESQSLIGNLRTVSPDAWRASGPGITRTIESIVLHVGACKVVYADHAFGARTATFASPEAAPWAPGTSPMDEVVAWVTNAHIALMQQVRRLHDGDLRQRRPANWGEMRET